MVLFRSTSVWGAFYKGFMLYNDGFSYKNITAAGTTTLTASRKGVLHAISMNSAFVGTVVLKDGATTIATFGTPSVSPSSVELNARFKDTLTAVSTGTPSVTLMYK